MLKLKHQNIDGCIIDVTTTASNVMDLINTAAGTDLAYAGFNNKANGIDIVPIDGNVHFMEDGNVPTAIKGQPLNKGYIYQGRNISIVNLKLISTTGGTVKCFVQPGSCNNYESTTITESSLSEEDILSSTATYTSVSMSLADTEYTYTLPSAAKSIEMRLDIDSTSDFKLNIGGGVGDSATDYIPVEDGELYWRQNLNLTAGTVLRFQSPSAGETMRIVTFA